MRVNTQQCQETTQKTSKALKQGSQTRFSNKSLKQGSLSSKAMLSLACSG